MRKRKQKGGREATGKSLAASQARSEPDDLHVTTRGGEAEPPTHAPSDKGRWYHRHRRDIRFFLLFAFFIGVFYVLSTTSLAQQKVFPEYLRINTKASATVLNIFGENVTAKDKTLYAPPNHSIVVERGCDAVEPSALFSAAVLASPAPLLARIGAVIVGTIFLMVLNLVRIISLFLVARYFRAAFDIMHLDVWQALFIFLAILFWALWAARVTRRKTVPEDAVV